MTECELYSHHRVLCVAVVVWLLFLEPVFCTLDRVYLVSCNSRHDSCTPQLTAVQEPSSSKQPVFRPVEIRTEVRSMGHSLNITHKYNPYLHLLGVLRGRVEVDWRRVQRGYAIWDLHIFYIFHVWNTGFQVLWRKYKKGFAPWTFWIPK